MSRTPSHPLFAYGHGLIYADGGDLACLAGVDLEKVTAPVVLQGSGGLAVSLQRAGPGTRAERVLRCPRR